MGSPYYTYKTTMLDGTNFNHTIGAFCLFRVSTSVTVSAAVNALNAYIAQYQNNAFPINIVDNVYGDGFTRSYSSSPCNGVYTLINVASNFAQFYLTFNDESLAGQQLVTYFNAMQADATKVFAMDIAYNYISPTSMSIRSIGFIFDNHV